jgi:hypothetical protein
VVEGTKKKSLSPCLVRKGYLPEFFLKNNCFLLKKGISCPAEMFFNVGWRVRFHQERRLLSVSSVALID